MPEPLDLDATEKRCEAATETLRAHCKSADATFVDLRVLLALVREAQMLLGACRVSLGVEYPATRKKIDAFLAKLEAPDA